MPQELTVRFRVDFGNQCSIGIGKIELLEGIAGSGSLSQAARRMRMSYRRAWLLLADLNLSFDEKVALTSTGGRGGGGVVLTPFGQRLILGYRKMESGLKPLADTYFQDFGARVIAKRAPAKKVAASSIKRKRAAELRS
jgi:molybdate transport system regulatory protein